MCVTWMFIQVSHQKLWTYPGEYVKEIYPVKIGIKEEEKFRIMDHILDNETEPFIIHLSENDDVNDNWDEM